MKFCKMRFVLACPAIAAAFIINTALAASARYDYVGPLFNLFDNSAPGVVYDDTMRLSGHFIFSNQLHPNTTYSSPAEAGLVEFLFSDGVQTLDQTNSGFDQSPAHFMISIGPSGLPVAWNIEFLALPRTGQLFSPGLMATEYLPNFPIAFLDDAGMVRDATSPGCERSGCLSQGFYRPSFGDPGAAIGTWSVSAVPLPSGLVLFAGALVCLRVRRKQ